MGGARRLSRGSGAGRASPVARSTTPSRFPVDRADGFVWPPHLHRRSWRGYRVSSDPSARPLHHIPLVEIANAMHATRTHLDLSWDSEELLRETLAVFGAKRLTEGVGSRLNEARRLARRLDG